MSTFATEEQPIAVSVFARTDIGQRRGENQDSFLVADLCGTEPPVFPHNEDGARLAEVYGQSFALGRKGLLLVVADGMGGAAAGALASRTAVEEIYRQMMIGWGSERESSPEHFVTYLRDAVHQANAAIHARALANVELRGMGTTATAVGALGTSLYLAQVGDSRAYLVRQGQATQLTCDQSLVQQMVYAGAMTEEDAERSSNNNLLLQALGTEPQVTVDLTFQELRRGDVVVICSDGLFRVVRKEELADIAGRVSDPAATCDSLIDLANSRGAPDNVTVIVVCFDGAGLRSLADSAPLGLNLPEWRLT